MLYNKTTTFLLNIFGFNPGMVSYKYFFRKSNLAFNIKKLRIFKTNGTLLAYNRHDPYLITYMTVYDISYTN